MSSLAADVADAVTANINAQDWCLRFTATRRWRAKCKLEELATLRVTVMPGPLSNQPLTRDRDRVTRFVDIAVQKRVDPDKNSEVDAVAELVEQLVAYFRAKNLQTGSGRAFVCRKPELISPAQTAVDRSTLDEEHRFLATIRMECVVLGAAS